MHTCMPAGVGFVFEREPPLIAALAATLLPLNKTYWCRRLGEVFLLLGGQLRAVGVAKPESQGNLNRRNNRVT